MPSMSQGALVPNSNDKAKIDMTESTTYWLVSTIKKMVSYKYTANVYVKLRGD